MQKFKLYCVMVLVGIFLTACDAKPQYSVLKPDAAVLVLGDSLSYGTGADLHEDYPSLLAAKTGWTLLNEGVPGNTSEQALARLPALLAAQKFDLLIVELGGNDFLRHVPEAQTINNLKVILEQSKAQNIPTVLLAIPAFSPIGAAFGRISDHALYAKLAKETNTPLIEDLFTEVLANNALKADPIHPNAQGYQLVAQKVETALRAFGFLAKH